MAKKKKISQELYNSLVSNQKVQTNSNNVKKISQSDYSSLVSTTDRLNRGGTKQNIAPLPSTTISKNEVSNNTQKSFSFDINNKYDDGYKNTGKKIGDYIKDSSLKDSEIFQKDNKFYYYDSNKKQYSEITNKTGYDVKENKNTKKTKQTAPVSEHFTNSKQSNINTTGKFEEPAKTVKAREDKLGLADRLSVDFSGKSDEDKKKMEDQLVQQEKDNSRVTGVVKGLEDSGYIKTGAFEDGYQFGDLTKTVGSTILSGFNSIGRGAMGMVEGIGDAINYVVAGAEDKLGLDDLAKTTREFAKRDLVDEITMPSSDAYQDSVLGNKSDSIVESIGGMLPSIALGGMASTTKGATALTSGSMFTSSYGQGVSEAYANGATDEEAQTYGLISGIAETATEMMFGGLGKGSKALGISKSAIPIDDVLAKSVSSKFKSKLAQNLTTAMIKSSGEGFEEVASGILQGIGKKMTFESDKELSDILKDEQLLDQFIGGAVASGIMQTPGLVKSTKQGRDMSTGYTDNEQKVVDNIIDSRFNESLKENPEMSKKEQDNLRNTIEETVKKDLDEGNLTPKEINDALGSDDYQTYQQESQRKQDLEKQLKELQSKSTTDMSYSEYNENNQKIADLQNEIDSINLDDLKNRADTPVENRIQNNDYLLQRSYNNYQNNQAQKNVAFEYQPHTDSKGNELKISALEKNVYDSASKTMNNTKESHNLADFVSKLSKDTGIKYEFTTTEDLKNRGYNVDNRVINGLNTDDGKILVNVDSDSIINRVVGHETTHLFENTEDYKTLQNELFEYAKTKGDFDKLKAKLTEIYKNVKGANIDNELTSELAGQYIFSDTEFVQNLSKHRNIFQKVYDEIKHLYKMATAGSKEARQLEKVKRTFEKVYQNNEAKVVDTAKFSIQTDKNGNKYVKVDTDQDIFKGKSLSEQNKIAKKYILNAFRKNGILLNDEKINVTSRTANEYTHPKRELNKSDMSAKLKASTELDNLLKISEYQYSRADDGRHGIAKDGWDYYQTIFKVDNNFFEGLINIAKNGDNKTLYDITKIKKTSLVGLDDKTSSTARATSFSKNNVSQSNNNVKSNTSTKYSISKNENYTQNSNKSSFSVEQHKQQQLDIIQNNNPVNDDYHTWIRNTDDIKTFEETLQDDDWSSGDDFDPDYTWNMAQEALNNGEITVYSSYPIEQGIFVTPSKMEAESYSDNGKIYSKTVNLLDVAWIDPTQGQYAKIDNNNIKTVTSNNIDNHGRTLTKQQQEYFKDSKIRVNEGDFGYPMISDTGKLFEVYHGTNNGQFNVFDNKFVGSSNDTGWYGKGFYFAFSESEAKYYGNKVIKAYLNIKNPFNFSKEMQTYDGISSTNTDSDFGSFMINLKNKFPKIADNEYLKYSEYNNKTNDYDSKTISISELANKIEEIYNSPDLKIVEINDNGVNKYQYTYGQDINNYDMPERLRNLLKDNMILNFIDAEFALKNKQYYKLSQEDLEQIYNFYKNNDVSFSKDFIGYPVENKDLLENSKLGEVTYYVTNKIYHNLEKHMPEYYMQYLGDDITNELKNKGYDGVIQSSSGDEIVAFYPNQIKRIDNLNPTNNDDIRYSLDNNNLVPLKNGEIQSQDVQNKNRPIAPLSTSSDTLSKNISIQNNTKVNTTINDVQESTKETTVSNKTLNPVEIAQIKPENASTTPKVDNIKVSTGNGKSRFFDNIKDKVNMLSEDSKAKILSEDEIKYYKEVTNEDSLNKAFTKLAENGEVETRAWFNKASEKATDVDVAEGWILMKQYENVKDYDGMVQVAKKMREIGTKAGQTVQAFNIMNRMTPEGMVKYAQSELSEAYEQMIKGKTKKWIDQHRSDFDLKPEEVQFIMDNMQEVATMKDGYDKKVKLAEIQKLMTDKIPPERGQGIKAWMRISMLFNPKTQVRNVAGNALIAPVNAFGDLFASGIDRLVARKTGIRTVGTTKLKSYAKGVRKGLFESYNDFKKGINTRNIAGNRFEIGEGKSFNDNTKIGKSLNRVDSLLSFMLDAGDRMFYEGSFVNSINNQMVLNNTDVVTQEMIDIATQEALSRTWQDNNNYTRFVLSVRKMMNNINIKGYGLGDVLIPFAKTPANLTKALVDYSPAGLVSTLIKGYDLKKSINNGQYTAQMQHEFVQSLGKATAGTMLYVFGYALAKAGILSGESDDDKDVSNFMKNTMGVNSYSIKIGDKSFTYDWAQPIAGPFSMMANLVNKQDQEASLGEKITSTLDTAGNIILEQSFMESINTVLSNRDGIATGIEEAILDLPARAIPTVMKQVTDMVDGTQRVSFEYDKPLQSSINSIKAKIPGLSQTLAPSVDSMGREIKKYGGKNNIFNVFFNPANVANENVSESAKEIYRVYKQTGDSTILPRVAPYYVNSDGEKIILSSKQREKLQKESGQLLEQGLDNMMKNDTYINASDEDKAEMINGLVNYSYNIAQHEVVGTELSQTYEKAYSFASNGGNIENYYIYKFDTKDMGSNEKEKYLYNSDVSDEQKTLLYENITLSDFSDESKYLNYKTAKQLGVDINSWLNYSSQEFKSDIAPTGKTISGSKKNKLISFVNSLNLSIPQKASLIKMSYSSYDNYDKQIMNEVNSLNISFMDKAKMVKTLGFDEYDKSIINYVDKNYSNMSEKTNILKDLGFTVYTYKGRTYVR